MVIARDEAIYFLNINYAHSSDYNELLQGEMNFFVSCLTLQ